MTESCLQFSDFARDSVENYSTPRKILSYSFATTGNGLRALYCMKIDRVIARI